MNAETFSITHNGEVFRWKWLHAENLKIFNLGHPIMQRRLRSMRASPHHLNVQFAHNPPSNYCKFCEWSLPPSSEQIALSPNRMRRAHSATPILRSSGSRRQSPVVDGKEATTAALDCCPRRVCVHGQSITATHEMDGLQIWADGSAPFSRRQWHGRRH